MITVLHPFFAQQVINWWAALRAANRVARFRLDMEPTVGKAWFDEHFASLLQRFHDDVVEDMAREGWFKTV